MIKRVPVLMTDLEPCSLLYSTKEAGITCSPVSAANASVCQRVPGRSSTTPAPATGWDGQVYTWHESYE
jgi:hypothetical protein